MGMGELRLGLVFGRPRSGKRAFWLRRRHRRGTVIGEDCAPAICMSAPVTFRVRIAPIITAKTIINSLMDRTAAGTRRAASWLRARWWLASGGSSVNTPGHRMASGAAPRGAVVSCGSEMGPQPADRACKADGKNGSQHDPRHQGEPQGDPARDRNQGVAHADELRRPGYKFDDGRKAAK